MSAGFMAMALRRIIISVAFWMEGKTLTEVVKGALAEGMKSFVFWGDILAVLVRLRFVAVQKLGPEKTLNLYSVLLLVNDIICTSIELGCRLLLGRCLWKI
jgi:hypothetical protein